jgi:hypothetical protein
MAVDGIDIGPLMVGTPCVKDSFSGPTSNTEDRALKSGPMKFVPSPGTTWSKFSFVPSRSPLGKVVPVP